MAALARSLPTPAPHIARRPRGVAPVALRVAHPAPTDDLDLDAAWVDATAPHRVAAARDPYTAPVISLDDARARARARRRTIAPRVLRARLLAVAFVLGLAFLLALGAGGLGADADGPAAVADTTVVVQPGQTLWDVAVEHTPAGADARDTMARIRQLNGLTGTQVPAWTSVVLPAGAAQ